MWPIAEKSGAEIYTHRMPAYWSEPEPTLTEWFISDLDPVRTFLFVPPILKMYFANMH
jgi:hypothetical protein